MPKRTAIRARDEKERGTSEQEDKDLDPPQHLVRKLVQSLREGKTFLWIWALVAVALVALSVTTIFTTAGPKGVDFSWTG
jgi:hypothetical protein